MNKMKNQAVTSHPIFFDPLNKKAVFGSGDGIDRVRYEDERPGVTVYENGDVEFCYYAPHAKSVQVAGISGSLPREKIDLEDEGNGYFSKCVSGIKKGFHYHDWFIDGVRTANPAGMFCYGCFGAMNFFEIPDGEDDFFLMKDVPHGTVRMEQYHSGVNGRMKTVLVYTPPGYENQSDKVYPVLYLQHGVGENETGWIWSGKANFILDNLLAQGKCREMVLVMNSGYAFRPGEEPIFYPGDFDSELVYDCLPFIESRYRVGESRGQRAIAGLSLGSAQAAVTAAQHPDLFGALGVFSGVSTKELDSIMERSLRYEIIALTSGDKEDGIRDRLADYGVRLNAHGILTKVYTYEGFHEWSPWRCSLRDFAQEIFRLPEGSLLEYPSTLSVNRVPEKPDTGLNQAYTMHPLFHDPVHKQVLYAVDEHGNPAGRYGEIPAGIEVTNTGTVCFDFHAPEAESVEAGFLGGEKFPLKKQENGHWTVELRDVKPGFHYVDFYINGNLTVNQQAPVGYGAFHAINFFEMPEPDFDLHLLKNVPHGSVRLHSLKSGQTGRMKAAYVYVPAGYDQSVEKYPVVYLQHGGGENEIGWIWQGKIGNIFDNLLAAGKCRKMLIVMTTGYSFRPDGTSHPQLGSFEQELTEDLVPFIDAHYRTLTDKHHRAMSGLSMGGIQSQRIFFKNLEMFSSCGIFSGGFVIQDKENDYTSLLHHRERFEQQVELLFVACGEQDGYYADTHRNVTEVMNKYDLPLTFYHTAGIHDWTFWRHCAAEFLQKLFQQE